MPNLTSVCALQSTAQRAPGTRLPGRQMRKSRQTESLRLEGAGLATKQFSRGLGLAATHNAMLNQWLAPHKPRTTTPDTTHTTPHSGSHNHPRQHTPAGAEAAPNSPPELAGGAEAPNRPPVLDAGAAAAVAPNSPPPLDAGATEPNRPPPLLLVAAPAGAAPPPPNTEAAPAPGAAPKREAALLAATGAAALPLLLPNSPARGVHNTTSAIGAAAATEGCMRLCANLRNRMQAHRLPRQINKRTGLPSRPWV